MEGEQPTQNFSKQPTMKKILTTFLTFTFLAGGVAYNLQQRGTFEKASQGVELQREALAPPTVCKTGKLDKETGEWIVKNKPASNLKKSIRNKVSTTFNLN